MHKTDIDSLVPHMPRVQTAQRDLRDLGVVWQMIESSAAISCPEEVGHILPSLVSTRERFEDLQDRLVHRMAEEHRAELGDELNAKAQCTIDILVRNLFERTADVGFLATDEVVRAFCAEGSAADRDAMVRRLTAYQAKYTVYDDIVLLAPDGRVLARLDDGAALSHSQDPILAQALKRDGHAERFGTSDLAGGERAALLYAHRIADAATGCTVGVLVLRFRFEDELRRIFADMADDRLEMALVLLDDQRRVIATNDDAHVPHGAVLREVPAGVIARTTFAGREYLAVACATHGYQGYMGPGWRAQAMVSLLTAFDSRHGNAPDSTQVPLDNDDLQTICRDADAINRDLRRAVWNGRLSAVTLQGNDARMKAVLTQVNRAGLRTRDRVDLAIRELYRTSIARIRTQSADLARLAADVMDRNLYERANDCRWWALSPAIQAALAAPADAASSRRLNAVLDHINGLYTVYSRLVVFDAAGIIRGASRLQQAEGLVGRPIDSRARDAALGLSDPQRYAVSDFGPTPLHDAGDTYVYMAGIRGTDGHPLGGIAIVFNAAREFDAMLREVLGERPGTAAFVDAGGRALARTSDAFDDPALTRFEGDAAIVAHCGVHYACARVRSTGYREFKTSDGYDNHVHAVVALRLGTTERRRSALSDQLLSVPALRAQEALELALFQVGPLRYALPVGAVLDALPVHGLVRTPSSQPMSAGMLEVDNGAHRQLVQVMCARRLFGVDYPARASDGIVLVLRDPHDPAAPLLGLRVDDVMTVLTIDRRALHAGPDHVVAVAPWLDGLLNCTAEAAGQRADVLVQLVDAGRLRAALLGRRATASAAPARPPARMGLLVD